MCKVVNVICRPSPISLEHMSSRWLSVDPHLSTHSSYINVWLKKVTEYHLHTYFRFLSYPSLFSFWGFGTHSFEGFPGRWIYTPPLRWLNYGLSHFQPQLQFYFFYTQLLLKLKSGFDRNDCPSYWCNSWTRDDNLWIQWKVPLKILFPFALEVLSWCHIVTTNK